MEIVLPHMAVTVYVPGVAVESMAVAGFWVEAVAPLQSGFPKGQIPDGVGEALVRDCLSQARALGFGVLQFNAVVATNIAALRLYEKLGFVRLGTIPRGFRLRNGQYADIIPHYRALTD